MDLRIILHAILLITIYHRTVANEHEGLTAEEGLRRNLSLLTDKYDMLCSEMRLISQHVVFLEQALSDLSHDGDVLYRKKRETGPEAEKTLPTQTLEVSKEQLPSSNLPEKVPEISDESPVTTGSRISTTQDDSLIVVRMAEVVTESSESASSSEQPPTPESSKDREEIGDHKGADETGCKCNLLHEYSCPIDKSKSFDNQFNDWFHNLLFSMSQNCSKGAKEFATRHHKSKHRHRHRHHNRQHRTIRNRSMDQIPHTMNPTQLDQMEQTLTEDDTVYATCDVIPNRHISLILQQNVKGRINLWQRSDGHGALHAHIQLSGFRVTVGERRRRETNLMPIETPATSSGSSVLSLEHGFHVHASGDLSRSCQSTGTHFNPTNSDHGGPMDSIRHAGDLGNIRVDDKGVIDAEYSYPYVSLVGEQSIIGKSLVIHAQADDFSQSATGNSGPKIACCVIEKVTRLPFLGDTNSAIEGIRGDNTNA